jgi:serine/threonine-protein kinase HipA
MTVEEIGAIVRQTRALPRACVKISWLRRRELVSASLSSWNAGSPRSALQGVSGPECAWLPSRRHAAGLLRTSRVTRTLSVWWDQVVVGTLQINQHGEMRFTYTAKWLADASRPPISFSLPKQEQPYKQRQCRPFFAGLLPEESQRDMIAAALGISKGNDFAFLEALGGDVAGALSLWPEGEAPPVPEPTGTPRPLSDDELIELLETLPKRPLLAGREGLRLSLAGAQTKLPVVLVDDRVALPAPGQPTTHILKPAIVRFPHTTENEALVMTLAAAVGLPVAPVAARSLGGRSYLLVTRYDRRFDASGQTHRLHQEDFCQALGIPPERKYAAEGGPTFKIAFDLLRRATVVPAVSVLAFLDAAIFNLIVGNADAHGKNFSLLYQAAGVTLAPFYDLLSTIVYPSLSPNLAMKIAKRATLEEISSATWPVFADDIGLAASFVRRRVKELSVAVGAQVPSLPDSPALAALDAAALKEYAGLSATRAERRGRRPHHVLARERRRAPDLRAMALAPMAVIPQRQRIGIGSELVRAGLEECRRLGAGAVFVVGHSSYYPRFGFSPR